MNDIEEKAMHLLRCSLFSELENEAYFESDNDRIIDWEAVYDILSQHAVASIVADCIFH